MVNVEKRVCVKDELFIGKEISRLTKRVDGSICMHTVDNWIKMSFENHDTYVRRAKNEKEAEEIHIQYMIPVNKFLLLKDVLFEDIRKGDEKNHLNNPCGCCDGGYDVEFDVFYKNELLCKIKETHSDTRFEQDFLNTCGESVDVELYDSFQNGKFTKLIMEKNRK